MEKEIEKLNIFQKLQKSRVELQNKALKKTGSNKFSNYNYFELGDFLPAINEICNNNGLSPIFNFTRENAKLTIYDVDNLDSKLEFETPVEIATLKGASAIQNIGGTQSYARRYLYIMAFEISESDMIEGGELDHDKIQGAEKINKASAMTIRKLIEETGTDEVKFLSWAKVKSVDDLTNDVLGTCITMLNKKKEEAKAMKVEQNNLQKQLKNGQEDFKF